MKPMTLWAPPAWKLEKTPTLGQGEQPVTYNGGPLVPAFNFSALQPENLKTGAAIGIGGAGVAALSNLLPDSLKVLGVISGVLIAGLGVYKVYAALFGDPKEELCEVPQQSTKDLSLVQGEFLAPVDKGAAELSTMWSVFWKTNRTYVLKFRILNNSNQELTVPLQVKVSEHTTIGEDKVSTGNFCVTVPAHGQKIFEGFMPVLGEMAFGISCVGQLILKYPTPTGANERILQVVQFTI